MRREVTVASVLCLALAAVWAASGLAVSDQTPDVHRGAAVRAIELTLAEARTLGDPELARRLSELDPSERLSPARYQQLAAQLPGKSSAQVLSALYDLSQLQEMPPADLPRDPAPDPAEQGSILQSAVRFAAQVTRKMPDLLATRKLLRYQDLVSFRGAANPEIVKNRPFRLIDQSSASVKFREGREVVESDTGNRPGTARQGLDTWGTFGPTLQTVVTNVLNGKIGWKHWEDGPTGRLTVFRYAVPEESSDYEVRFCCYLERNGFPTWFGATPAYHGEIAIDSRTGAIMRLLAQTDLKFRPGTYLAQLGPIPVLRADVLVEYGPVIIGGKEYICPVRAISVMTSWNLGLHGPANVFTEHYAGSKAARQAVARAEHSRVTAINEATFTNYHVFRSDMRIVTANTLDQK